MAIGLILIEQILVMICMAAVGVIMSKTGLVSGEQSRTLSQVMVYACSPCALVTAFQTDFTADKAAGLLASLLAAALTLVLFTVMTELLLRAKGGISAAEGCCALFSNSGNLVLPIVQSIWGPAYVIYICPYLLLQNILVWSYGMRRMGGQQKSFLKMMLHPNIIAVLLGALMFVTNVRLPGPLLQGLTSVGNSIGPISMMVIGILLAETPLRPMLRDKRVFRTVALRLIVYPLAAVAVSAVVGIAWQSVEVETVMLVILLSSLGPSASNITAIAQTLRHPETSLVSSVNAMSVLLCTVSMPLQCMLLQTAFNVF